MDSDDNWLHLRSPVASILASVRAQTSLGEHDTIRAVARETDSPALRKIAAEKLADFEKHAEESQWWA